MHGKLWTQEERDVIINNPDLKLTELKQLLPNRTIRTISCKRVNLRRNLKMGGTSYEQPVWTKDELAILKRNKIKTIEQLCELLPLHSYFGIFRKINENEALRKANERAEARANLKSAKFIAKAKAKAAEVQARNEAQRAKSKRQRQEAHKAELRQCSQFFMWLDQRAAV